MMHGTPIDFLSFRSVPKPGAKCVVLWLVFATGFISGCGTTQVAPSNVDEAHKLLTTTLDAWVAGETLDDQRNKKPPVYVAEDLWFSDTPLSRYEVNSEGELVGTNVRFHVTLQSGEGNRRGKSFDVYYLVTTVPARTIAREDR